MTESAFRMYLAVLLTIFLGGLLFVLNKWAENGRYQQLDLRKNHLPGNGIEKEATFFDTHNGKKEERP
jgi:hypothetical protein